MTDGQRKKRAEILKTARGIDKVEWAFVMGLNPNQELPYGTPTFEAEWLDTLWLHYCVDGYHRKQARSTI